MIKAGELSAETSLPRSFEKFSRYTTRDMWVKIYRAVCSITRLGRGRSGSEPDLVQSGDESSYICRLHAFQRTMRPADMLSVIDSISDSASVIEVLMRKGLGSNRNLGYVELVIPSGVLHTMDTGRGRRRSPPSKGDGAERYAAMNEAIANSDALQKLGGISAVLKRTALDVLSNMNRQMAHCMMNASLSIRNHTASRVDLVVGFDPMPVDVRLLHSVVMRFGPCISDMCIDVNKGVCLITFCVPKVDEGAPRRRRRRKKKKKTARNPSVTALPDGAVLINENTVVFERERPPPRMRKDRMRRKRRARSASRFRRDGGGAHLPRSKKRHISRRE